MAELRFDDRVAVVTGSGRGLGRSHALALASRGASVVVNDVGAAIEGGGRDDAVAQGVVAEIEAGGGAAVADGSDVSTTVGAEALVRAALDTFGRIDVVINNAGIIRWTEFPEVVAAEMESHLAVHALGSFNVSRAAWPHFEAQQYGRIVNTISSAFFGGSNVVSYGTAKGAVLGLTRSLAATGDGHGIAVNAIAPIAWTRMMESAGVSPDSEMAAQMTAELVSSVLAFLAHETCTANGQVYAAGGGPRSAHLPGRDARLFDARPHPGRRSRQLGADQ